MSLVARDRDNAGGPARGMTQVPGGTFRMGSNAHYPEEAPVHTVAVDDFAIDSTAVTNEEFAEFVDATGYQTLAEQAPNPDDYPGAPAENLVAGSLVFTPTSAPVELRHLSQWWTWTPGACWRQPEGAGSSLAGRENHPVVHIAYEDAAAYATWAGKALPTEAEWEFAARGGRDGAVYTWGDDPERRGQKLAHYWHGDFPWRAESGYGTTASVASYPPNDFGLFDMAGNVWEWTDDWYLDSHGGDADRTCCVPVNPRVRSAEESYDPAQPQFQIPRKVIKGGSFLCADNYCLRYRPAARRPQMVDSGMSHIGFRCVMRSTDANAQASQER